MQELDSRSTFEKGETEKPEKVTTTTATTDQIKYRAGWNENGVMLEFDAKTKRLEFTVDQAEYLSKVLRKCAKKARRAK